MNAIENKEILSIIISHGFIFYTEKIKSVGLRTSNGNLGNYIFILKKSCLKTRK